MDTTLTTGTDAVLALGMAFHKTRWSNDADEFDLGLARERAGEMLAALRADPSAARAVRDAIDPDGLPSVIAALPLTGWPHEDGRWVIPSGEWAITLHHYPADGDGFHEPHYPEWVEGIVEVSPGKRVMASGDTPETALAALRRAIEGTPDAD